MSQVDVFGEGGRWRVGGGSNLANLNISILIFPEPYLQIKIQNRQLSKMFNQRNQHLDHNMDIPITQVTPLRNRAPTPISKVPLKIMNNKQNNPRVIQTDPIYDKPMINQDRNKKPLISPVRNPFKANIEKQHPFNHRNTSQNFFEHAPNQQPFSNNFNSNYYPQDNAIEESNQLCTNHSNKTAEYISYIEDNQILYCGKCAAQLASQGFEVKKIEPTTVKKGDPTKCMKGQQFNNQRHSNRSNRIPRYPQYQGNPMYETIVQFFQSLKTVESEHLTNMEKLENVDQHYAQQIDYTNNFYQQLLEMVQQMKQDHLCDLEEQHRKHSQIAIIQYDYLRENIDEMQKIYEDIDNNLEVILEKLDESEFQQTMNEYWQKTQVFRHKTQEQSDFFAEVIDFSEDEIKNKLQSVKEYLIEVWNEPKPKPIVESKHYNEPEKYHSGYHYQEPANHPQMTKNHQHAIGKPVPQHYNHEQQQQQGENQPAFRRLFEDEESLMAETSPQFKKI